jgi:hypothetical protein
MSTCHQTLQPIDIIESPIQLNQCPVSRFRYFSLVFGGSILGVIILISSFKAYTKNILTKINSLFHYVNIFVNIN